MEILTVEPTAAGIKSVVIRHQGESVEIPTGGFSSIKIANVEHMWDEVNQLVARLPMATQQRLFELYSQMEEMILDVIDIATVEADLNAKVIELYEIVTHEDAYAYVTRMGNVAFPPDLKTEYLEKDRWVANFEIRTYLKPEYLELVTLILGMRFMVPIWGHYLQLTSAYSGNEFKEDMAAFLIEGSELTKWPGYNRVASYIKHTASINSGSMALVLAGLSSIEIPDYLVNLTIVRRLSTAPISFRTDRDHLVKTTYNFVKQNVDRLDKGMNQQVRAKKPRSEIFEDDNSSQLDMYRQSQDVPDGIKLISEIFTENVRVCVTKIEPDIEMREVNRAISRANKMSAMDITEFHLTLVKWVMNGTISPRSIDGLTVEAQLRCIGMVQAVLMHWGFGELAELILATPVDLTENQDWAIRDAKSRVSKKLVEELALIYPYFRRSMRRSDYDKIVIVPVAAIDIMTDFLNQYGWASNPEPIWPGISEITLASGQICIPSDIRDTLAKLILKINSR